MYKVVNDLLNLCDEAKGIHGSLMGMLPESKKEKHDIWFKAKMIVNSKYWYRVLKMKLGLL